MVVGQTIPQDIQLKYKLNWGKNIITHHYPTKLTSITGVQFWNT